MQKVPVFKPLLEEEEFAAARKALELGWLGMGSFVAEFEAKLLKFIQAPDRHVVALGTGYAALHLGLIVAGIGPGNEVITPSLNNITDFQAILAVGARPVLCDIEDRSLCIDLRKAETLVGPQTKAIIVTDYACMLCDHDAVARFAERHRLRVIHDAAHSLGSHYKGQPVGGFSDLTMFSFDPIKTVTCIDGGALVVKSKEEVELLHELRLVGMTQPSRTLYQNQRAYSYDVRRIGFRDHLANLHAALGLAQLEKIERITSSRRRSCRRYTERLRHVSAVAVPSTDFSDVTPFMYAIRVPADRRESFRATLLDQGIDTGFHWQPGHWFTLLKSCRQGDLSVTEKAGREIVTLPLHSMMPDSTVDAVADAVVRFFET